MSKSLVGPGILLTLLYLCLAAYLVFSAIHLPDRMATHFDFSGKPDEWKARSSHLLFMSGFGLFLPLLPVVLCFLMRFLPGHSINLPRRDYWLAAPQRGATFAYLFRHSLWLACLTVLFLLGIQYLITQANVQPVVQLSTTRILVLSGAFVAGIILWSVLLIRHFRRAS